MNENESMNTSTEETQVNAEETVENTGENTNDVTVDRDFVPDDQDVIPPTPTFSDGSDATEEGNNNSINIPFPDYSKLFDTYKQLFENVTEDIDNINNRFTKIAEIIDKNSKETNAAIKATQIYSKLFTKLSIGINIIFAIAIIVLFIIK